MLHADSHVLFIFMLNVIMLSVVMMTLSIITLSIKMGSYVTLSINVESLYLSMSFFNVIVRTINFYSRIE